MCERDDGCKSRLVTWIWLTLLRRVDVGPAPEARRVHWILFPHIRIVLWVVIARQEALLEDPEVIEVTSPRICVCGGPVIVLAVLLRETVPEPQAAEENHVLAVGHGAELPALARGLPWAENASVV